MLLVVEYSNRRVTLGAKGAKMCTQAPACQEVGGTLVCRLVNTEWCSILNVIQILAVS